MNSSLWWARLGSNQRPADYESERSCPTRSSDVVPNTGRRRPCPASPPSSGKIHPIGSQDWQSKSWPKTAIAGRGFGPAASLSRTLTSRVLGGPEGSSVPTPNSDLDPEDRRRLGNSIIHATIASVISHYLRIWEVSGSKITCELSAASTRRDLLPAT
jgi:hypothetical protein